MVPFTKLPFSCVARKFWKGSCSSCLMPKEIRSRSESTAKITVSSSSPFLNSRTDASPSSAQEMSDMWTRPSIPPSSPMKIPKSVIDLIFPEILSPLLCVAANSSHGLVLHCFMPKEIRRRSSSISNTITSTSSPNCTSLDGLTFLLVQSISETWTKPSTPSSISTKQP